jgi:type I restriction enzyme M protein
VKWIGSDDPTLINDERFAPAGVLAPKSKADFAFVLHALNYLSSKGRAAIVCFPGIFYRGGAEQKIRQYLVDNNYVETVISLAPNLFYGTTIAVNILVLAQEQDRHHHPVHRRQRAVQERNQQQRAAGRAHRANHGGVRQQGKRRSLRQVGAVEIIVVAKDYNLSVSTYVEAKDTREVVDIAKLNADLKTTVAKIDRLRKDIDAIVAEIEGEELEA